MATGLGMVSLQTSNVESRIEHRLQLSTYRANLTDFYAADELGVNSITYI